MVYVRLRHALLHANEPGKAMRQNTYGTDEHRRLSRKMDDIPQPGGYKAIVHLLDMSYITFVQFSYRNVCGPPSFLHTDGYPGTILVLVCCIQYGDNAISQTQ
jgi:hypothetical protein